MLTTEELLRIKDKLQEVKEEEARRIEVALHYHQYDTAQTELNAMEGYILGVNMATHGLIGTGEYEHFLKMVDEEIKKMQRVKR